MYLLLSFLFFLRYSSAWTLLGHEFIELRNIGAAVYVYRRAVGMLGLFYDAFHKYVYENLSVTIFGLKLSSCRAELCRQDFRAWYGLAQTYELLRMPLYALFYFRRACALRPGDARSLFIIFFSFCLLLHSLCILPLYFVIV